MLENKPLVSIFMATYNHAAYIGQALDSCLKQETTFDFEIVVCDDCSNDGTSEIIREYARKYPQVVPSIQPVNTKATKNFMDGLNKLRGKYVAFCEGDDFWTDTNKLQKQISFLEENPDFTVCCHKVKMLDMGKGEDQDDVFIYKDMRFDEKRIKEGIFYADEAISNYFFQTSSVVFRWRFTEGLPNWFTLYMLLDHFLFMLHAVEGKIKYFDEDMSVWRRHPGGYSWLQTINKGLFFRQKYADWIIVYEEMDRFFSYRFTLQIRERILLVLRNLISHYMQTNQLEQIKEISQRFKKYFDKPVLENSIILDAMRIAMPENREFFPPWVTDIDGYNHSKEQNSVEKSLGSFFELDINSMPKSENSIWDYWVNNNEVATFANPTQALISLLMHYGIRTLWLPSYAHPHIAEIKDRIPLAIRIYPINSNYEPMLDFLDVIPQNEAVLLYSYFGKGISSHLEEAISQRQDILWIEERSQALWTNKEPKGQVIIYKPSELLGVPDGTLLVGKGVSTIKPLQSQGHPKSFYEKLEFAIDRMENTSPDAKQILKYSTITQRQHLPQGRASKLTIEMLKRIPLMPIVEKRIRNWKYLYKHLREYSFWQEENLDFAPYCFCLITHPQGEKKYPVDMLTAILSNQKIFCLPHMEVKADYRCLFKYFLTLLPCDQRMEIEDLDRMITIIKEYMRGEISPNKVAAWQ